MSALCSFEALYSSGTWYISTLHKPRDLQIHVMAHGAAGRLAQNSVSFFGFLASHSCIRDHSASPCLVL